MSASSTAAVQLIVTADDFGYSVARNRGIIEAFEAEVITCTSLLLGFPGTGEAVRYAREQPQRSFGLHLNLTEGAALSGSSSLTDSGGSFLGQGALHRRLQAGTVTSADVRAEIGAQLDAAGSAGVTLGHVDGHHHVHLLPVVAPALAELAAAHGLRWARTTLEEDASYVPRDPEDAASDLARRDTWRWMETWARPHYRAAGLGGPDRFLGLAMSVFRAWSLELTLTMLESLGPGITEWMTHPGYDDASGDDYARRGRTLELEILRSPVLEERLADLGVQRVTPAAALLQSG